MEDEGVPGFDKVEPAPDVSALCIAWCAEDARRVGEVVLLPSRRGPWCFGRGDSPVEGAERVLPVRQRPGHNARTGPISDPRLSRSQLFVTATTGKPLQVENRGQCRLYVDGFHADRAEVRPGQVLQVGSCLVLRVTERPWELQGDAPGFAFGDADGFGIVGESPGAWELRRRLALASQQAVHVLVQGASGAGKELVARALHKASYRGAKNFVARNAATIPETLVDAELFGNVRNYPNAGMPERPGLIGEAHQGTLFLDEVGELSEAVQGHLLRVLDEGEYHRLGEAVVRRADFRLVAATRRPLESLRHDLLARFRVQMRIPGLDERADDIPLLVRFLLGKIGDREPWVKQRFLVLGSPRISPAFVRLLLQHRWTAHTRELEALLRAAMSESPGNFLDVPPSLLKRVRTDADEEPPTDEEVDPTQIPVEMIRAALERNGGNQSKAWRELGLSSRHVLTRLIKRHGL